MIRKIVLTKNPSLRAISKPVGKIDKKILQLISDMKETLASQKDPEGVGLAAPQIGKNLRLFIISFNGQEKVCINPEILEVTEKLPQTGKKTKKGKGQKNDILEGCLSLPRFYGPLTRAELVKISYTNEKGEKITEDVTGFMAQIVQHEVDHLNGIIFLDHILSQKAPLYKFEGDDWEEVELT
jgi:peptide deformylase